MIVNTLCYHIFVSVYESEKNSIVHMNLKLYLICSIEPWANSCVILNRSFFFKTPLLEYNCFTIVC